jgi:stage II sporulation protein GA (sporulation sigma-E factor processing peptidase)
VYSGACLLHSFRFLGSILWRIVMLAGMAGIAFGWNRSACRRCGVFVLLSLALGGLAVSIGKGNTATLLLSAAGMWLLCRVAFGDGVGGREYVQVEITEGEVAVSLTALRDSGNTLRDPITGESVLVIGAAAAQKLTGLTAAQLRSPLENVGTIPGLRLIPYRAVGCSGGMLLAKRFDQATIGGKRRSVLVAFAPEGLGEGQMYQALTGGAL